MFPLPQAEIVSCYLDESPFAALHLRWPEDGVSGHTRAWQFPEGVRLLSALPDRFGVNIHRIGDDTYQVGLVWNRLSLTWANACRADLLNSCIGPMLCSIGTDLSELLNQPIQVDLAPLSNVA
jgi:hypothetical protein